MTQPLPHFLSPTSLSLDATQELFERALELKKRPIRTDLAGQSAGLVFFNPSLRTRTSMDISMYQLGGHAVMLDVGVGTWKLEHREGRVMDGDAAEHVKEAAKVLSRYVQALGIRSFPERRSWGEDRMDPILSAFAKWADRPAKGAADCHLLGLPPQGAADGGAQLDPAGGGEVRHGGAACPPRRLGARR
jgi:N-acetylornithine carbamoyltransferase